MDSKILRREDEVKVLSGSEKAPLYIRLARLVEGWNEFVIYKDGVPEGREWRYMTDKQRVEYLKEMLKEYE